MGNHRGFDADFSGLLKIISETKGIGISSSKNKDGLGVMKYRPDISKSMIESEIKDSYSRHNISLEYSEGAYWFSMNNNKYVLAVQPKSSSIILARMDKD